MSPLTPARRSLLEATLVTERAFHVLLNDMSHLGCALAADADRPDAAEASRQLIDQIYALALAWSDAVATPGGAK